MGFSKLAKHFAVASLCVAAAGCSVAGNNNRGAARSLPQIPDNTYQDLRHADNKAGNLVDAETRQRIDEYHRLNSGNLSFKGERCDLDDRFDRKTGIVSYQATDRLNIALGVKGDGTRAAKMPGRDPDVAIRFTFSLQDFKSHKDDCLEGQKWRGVVPTGLRVAPDAIKEHKGNVPAPIRPLADQMLYGLESLGYK